jgi:riboflavin synthase
MFTGLIQDVGHVARVRQAGDGAEFALSTRLGTVLEVGASIAVNGVCLTAREITSGSRVVLTAVAETLSRTTLGELREDDAVNLEPALAVGDRMGGHYVQGHVDGVGTIVSVVEREQGREIDVSAPSELLRYIAGKGSVALDGISLTVARLLDDGFRVALIPHTLAVTTLGRRGVGARLNIETDILAKYVERLLTGAEQSTAALRGETVEKSKLTEAWLREQGY